MCFIPVSPPPLCIFVGNSASPRSLVGLCWSAE
ncbi:unnamed protein product [Gulo gulo]|uniref:Uncharacterized protein n=1 Tax=Gulo gulo TaxID=48420 RepID=A0A9X9Q6A4_GULGU|nr:unnamed protein product [Gulo gulo]